MNRISISATHQLPIDEFPRVQAVVLPSPAHGRYWLDDLINGETYQRYGKKLILSSGIVIHSFDLDPILASGERIPVDEHYHRQNLQFRRGPWHERPKADPVPKADRIPTAPKPERAKRPTGFITVAEIAAQLKVKPFDIRQALRNSGAVKPEFGWAFDPKEVASIKKLIGGK